MKINLLLSALLALAPVCAMAQTIAQTGVQSKAQSAPAVRETPGVSLRISLEKINFQPGEPIAVTFNYHNEGAVPITFTRSGTSYSPMRVVKREFRARGLDNNVLLQSSTPGSGLISEMVGTQILAPHQSVQEVVFLNERFFLERTGRYELTAWSSAVSLEGHRAWLQSAPIELRIVPPTEAFRAQVLGEAKAQIEAALAIARGRSLGSYPPQLQTASNAAQRLGWLRDERAIPVLVAALEIGNNYGFEAQNALRLFPHAAVKAAIRRRLDEKKPVTSSRDVWLELGADSPAEKQALDAQFDNRLRDALDAEADRAARGALASRGLVDSPVLRRAPRFWHEALTNLDINDQNSGFDLYDLLAVPAAEGKTRDEGYPIETADLKVALQSRAPFQVRVLLFHALEKRDAAFLREFLLARVDSLSFDYPRGAFDVFDDLHMRSVATKLITAIESPALGHDWAWRDEFGRRLRDLALRGVSLEQLEQTERWLLENAPEADAPILDAITLKMPSRTWLFLQQSLAKRPLGSPYDNRMRVLVLQKNPVARQIVRGLLQGPSQERRIEVLNAINGVVAVAPEEGARARWFPGDQVIPRASGSAFDDLEDELARISTSDTSGAAEKQAATQAHNVVMSSPKRSQ